MTASFTYRGVAYTVTDRVGSRGITVARADGRPIRGAVTPVGGHQEGVSGALYRAAATALVDAPDAAAAPVVTPLARYDAAVTHGTTITGWRDIAAALDESASVIVVATDIARKLRDRSADALARADRMARAQWVALCDLTDRVE